MFMGLMIILNPVGAQNSFSFNCTKDTSIICTTPCITLKTTLPDIHASTLSYGADALSTHSCFRGYIDPSSPGTTANLTIDDRYSPPIDIGFAFSFFGSSYSKLIASTNGFISFDVSKTATFSHYGILFDGTTLSATQGVPQDLPNNLYDRAIIMGPYHDLDPNNSLATQQIKYDVIGTAPYRKWIISYYNVPLYTTACLNTLSNTQQIVLYETIGLVEIFIYDKGICLNWNKGKSMMGMQDFSKANAVMAPGRKASSAPWGTKGFNESWRFIPATGQSLFTKVELYDFSGNFIATGSTAVTANNQLDVSFPNICPPSSGASYLVKSFYKDPNNPANEVIGIDTINVIRGDPVSVGTTETKCSQGSTGTITVTSPSGAAYEYSIDGINWQASNIFTAVAGTYTVRVRVKGSTCISFKSVSISPSTFSASIVTIVTPCPEPVTGSVTITPINGTPPYLYSLNGSTPQTLNKFSGLPLGTYTLVVTDAAGCVYSTTVIISVASLATAQITNTICGKPGSGSITLTPTFGTPPYTYSIDGIVFQSSNFFNNLNAGRYTIMIKDANSCSSSIDEIVKADASIITNPVIKMPACFGDANGSLTLNPLFGNGNYLFTLNGQTQSNNLFTNLKSGTYSLQIKDSIGCIKDTSVIILQPNPLRITSIVISASNCITPDGQITIKANGGTTPYLYSIDNGVTYQTTTIFNVTAGIHTVTVKDANGCITNIPVTVDALDRAMKVDLGNDKTICVGSSTTLASITTPAANYFRWTPSSGLNDSTSAAPIASPADTTTYILNAKSDVCFGADTIRVNVLHKPVVNAGNDTVICYNTSGILRGSATNLSGSVSYLWTPAADIISPNLPVTVVKPITIRSHTYRLQVTDNYGCNFSVFDDVKVFMNDAIRAFAGNDTIAAMGVPHQLFGSGGTNYLWSPANVLNNPALQNPIATLNNDTRFTLIVKDPLGCTGTSSVLVKVYIGSTYYIPNAFTPNGDGLNDVFHATAPGIQKTYYFRIYNRRGQLMYESNDATKGWDGTYRNVLQPSAVYVWTIKGVDAFGKDSFLKGTVTLIR